MYRGVCQGLNYQCRMIVFKGNVGQFRIVWRSGWGYQWLGGMVNQELVVIIVVGYVQFVRVLVVVFLYYVGDMGMEGVFDVGQFFKYCVVGCVCCIVQVLFSDFKRILCQCCVWCFVGVYQLICNLIRIIWILCDLVDDYGVNIQCRSGSRLYFLGISWLLWQMRVIQWIEFIVVVQVSCYDIIDIFWCSVLVGLLEWYYVDRVC